MASLEWSLVLVLGAFLGTSLGHQIQVQKKQAARTCRKKSIKEHWVSNKAKQSGEGRSCKERSIACVFGSRFFMCGVLLLFGFCGLRFETTFGLSADFQRTLPETGTGAGRSDCGDGGDSGVSWTVEPGQSLHAAVHCSSRK